MPCYDEIKQSDWTVPSNKTSFNQSWCLFQHSIGINVTLKLVYDIGSRVPLLSFESEINFMCYVYKKLI